MARSTAHRHCGRGRVRVRWRRFRRWLLRAAALGVVLLLAWGFVWEPGRLVERDSTLHLPHWPAQCDGLRVDLVADTHTGSPRNGVEHLDRLVRMLEASDADIVVLAGDYVILRVLLGHYVAPEVIAAHLAPLTRHKPVVAVLGNHDWWKGGPAIERDFRAVGIRVLEDQAHEYSLRGCTFWVVGVGDLWTRPHHIQRAFAEVTDAAPVLAVTHNPDLFPQMPARASLVMAGHTHGGQVRLPWLGSLVVPSRYGRRYAQGEVVEDGQHLFVTPGIGTSILPLRMGVPPQISRLTLVGEGRTMPARPRP